MKTSIAAHDRPVPHVIADFPESVARAAREAWPAADWPGWVAYQSACEDKRASDLTHPIPGPCALLLAKMAQFPVAYFFPETQLIPDLSLHGSGLHEMVAGKGLGQHLDADTHIRLGLERVLSAVLYVHEAWDSSWGGELMLADARIAPLPSRMVIFDCRRIPHAVAALTCPEDVSRKSLALFWYAPAAGTGNRLRAAFDGDPDR